jgi:hypothetical protein
VTVTLSAPAPQLSRVRTVLFGGLALVWFGEMLFTGVLASLFLFAPNTVLYWEYPCLSDVELASLRVRTLAAGSHLTALATATWSAAAHSRSNRTLRQAITLASIANTGLVWLLPLRQIVSHAGWNCSTSPVLIPFVPLLVGWVMYAAVGRTRGDL